MNKGEECSGCSLEHSGRSFGYDRLGNKPLSVNDIDKVKLVVWLEALGRREAEQGLALVCDSRFVLEQWGFRAVPELQLMNDRSQIAFCSSIRCQPPKIKDKNYPIGEIRTIAEKQCRQYDILPPSNIPILMLGEKAQQLWFRQELLDEDKTDQRLGREIKGLMGRLGRVWEKDGRQWIFGPHPTFIMRQPQLIEHLHAVLRITLSVLKGTRDVLTVPHSGMLPENGNISIDLEYSPTSKEITVNGLAWV